MKIGDRVILKTPTLVVADYNIENNTLVLLGVGDDCIIFPARAKPFYLSPIEMYEKPNLQLKTDKYGTEYHHRVPSPNGYLLYKLDIPPYFNEKGIYYLRPLNHPGSALVRKRDKIKLPPNDEILRWTAKTVSANDLRSTILRLFTKSQETLIYYDSVIEELQNQMQATLCTDDGALWWCPVKLLKMKSKILMLLVLFIAYSCGPDPADFERNVGKKAPFPENTIVNETEKEIEKEGTQSVTLPSIPKTTYSGEETMFVSIQKNIPINTVCTAVGYKDGVKGVPKREKVDIKFINISTATSLVVVHHISGEYSLSAEFPVKNNWKEDMLVEGSRLSTTVVWSDHTEQPLILSYDGEVLSKITLKSRTFYLQELPTIPIVYSQEGDRGEHIVQRGENLRMIAKKYNTTVNILLQLNEKLKSDPNTIQPGMGIRFEN